ncbi:hypothetical protein ACFMPD_14295 [Sedimentitalea sp. HM32M-2]|uniref:hypothetical protein n=1 Tax=Sedimentitalea sp. HM32M-2 TaxID=3351566 RepID=UPI00362EC1D9
MKRRILHDDSKVPHEWAFLALGIALTGAVALTPVTARANDPWLYDATVDTVFDIIREDDPSSYICMSYEGRATRQMWDKRRNNEFDLNVFLFNAYFEDMPPFEIVVNPEYESPEAARAEADRYGRRIGQVPLVFRHGITRFGIHMGAEGFHAGAGKIFVYSETSTRRIEDDHLEESLLHEAVHATLDSHYRLAPMWVAAQQADGRFLTGYAAAYPEREDLAETALFAYALLRHPGRIPPADSMDILRTVPARIEVVKAILDDIPTLPRPPTPPPGCR